MTADEIDSLNRFVVVFLETAELRAKNRKDLTTSFWRQNIDAILQLNDKAVLDHKGEISNAVMASKVKEIYAKFDAKRKVEDAQLADEADLKALEDLNKELKNRQ